ncbi:MAG: NUDIX domain-containing protein [Rhodococcus sp. (in: high G+C Gram-positive bacteria)]
MARVRTSAGIVLYRYDADELMVLLVHPGGPFWARKDAGAWSIPKGEYDPTVEDARMAAAREFDEELGSAVPAGEWTDLGEVAQSRAKRVHAFAVAGTFDVDGVVSNAVEMEWPPKSGDTVRFPEVDRARWCDRGTARRLILAGQRPFLDTLDECLRTS